MRRSRTRTAPTTSLTGRRLVLREDRAAGVVVGVTTGILLAGATNPYLFAAFGLGSIVLMVAWLEDDHGLEKLPQGS